MKHLVRRWSPSGIGYGLLGLWSFGARAGWAGCLAGLAAWLGWLPGRAGCLAVAAASRNHRELIRGETGNCDPLWGLKSVMPVRPIHGGFGGHFMVIWTRFMVIWIHGSL